MLIGDTRTWFNTILRPSLELIETFVGLIEKQTHDAIQAYKTGKKTGIVVEHIEGSGPFGQEIESYANLDSRDWNMKLLFEQHFPNLQRRAGLITVYGFFEHELVRLCKLFENEKSLGIAVNDLAGKGIQQSAIYLAKVAKINAQTNSHHWKAINQIRIVRNMVVHRDGRLVDAGGEVPKQETKAIEALKFIRKTKSEVILESEFVPQALDTFKNYFKLLDDSIQKAEIT